MVIPQENLINFYCGLTVSQNYIGERQIQIRKYEPIQYEAETLDDQMQLKCDFKVSQVVALSVSTQNIIGERNQWTWGVIGCGEDGIVRLWDFQ